MTTAISTATLDATPIWLAANFHVVNAERLDLWVGPQIAYVIWNDPLDFVVPGQGTYTLKTEDEFPALEFEFGLDWWIAKNSGLNFALRFVDADADSDHDLPVDPTFVTVGWTWKLQGGSVYDGSAPRSGTTRAAPTAPVLWPSCPVAYGYRSLARSRSDGAT